MLKPLNKNRSSRWEPFSYPNRPEPLNRPNKFKPLNPGNPDNNRPHRPSYPKNTKHMTIAAGFRVQDGILLCADTLYTSGIKFYETKLFKSDFDGGKVIFAVAGRASYGRMAIQDCQHAIKSFTGANPTLRTIEQLIRSEVKSAIENCLYTLRCTNWTKQSSI